MGKGSSAGADCLRGLLLIFNAIFLIFGIALIGIGIYVKVNDNFASVLGELAKSSSFETQSLGYLSFIMIGGGVVTVLIALFGCAGTLWTSSCVLNTYAVVLFILMIMELVAVAMAFGYKGKLQKVYETDLFAVLNTSLSNNNTGAIDLFHKLENNMHCCGVHNISDYAAQNYTKYSTWCQDNPSSKGCSQAIIDTLNKNLPAIGGSLGGLLVLEFFTFLMAILLSCALRRSPDEKYSSRPGEVLGYVVPRRFNYNH